MEDFSESKVIIEDHYVTDMNIESLVFEPISGMADCIIVSFSAMDRGSNFDRWNWFYRRSVAGNDVVYIIFKDEARRYYLGNNDDPMHVRYKRFLDRYLRKYNLQMHNVIAVGSSMGGYAALYYSFLYGFNGVCAANPQVDLKSIRRHDQYNSDWRIRSLESKWEDLTDFVFRAKGRPKVFIGHGMHPADFSAASNLISVLSERRISHAREFELSDDYNSYIFSEDRLFRLLDFWRSEMA